MTSESGRDEVIAQARDVLSERARSFRWGAQFLPPEQRDDAAVVYAFCRLVDDTADEALDAETARRELDILEDELMAFRAPRPLLHIFRATAARLGLELVYARELINGVRSDLGTVRFANDDELLRYCYRVAATVGLMMCPVLGVRNDDGLPHAVDLGVAMQLTNIARDVKEDADMGRVYLPENRLLVQGVSPDDLLDKTADAAGVSKVVEQLIDLAERYYESAELGMRFIPMRSRMAILVAARLYRAIGLKLRDSRDSNALAGRTVVTWQHKLRLVGNAVSDFASPELLGSSPIPHHDRSLHRPLQGLPGIR